MMKVRCCPSYIAVRSLLTGQVVLLTFFWLLIGQLFLAYDVIFLFETCLNLLLQKWTCPNVSVMMHRE